MWALIEDDLKIVKGYLKYNTKSVNDLYFKHKHFIESEVNQHLEDLGYSGKIELNEFQLQDFNTFNFNMDEILEKEIKHKQSFNFIKNA